MNLQIITLSNGKRVANFSSPHPFTFTDGSILPAVSDEEAERLKVTFIETNYLRGDVGLRFELSKEVMLEVNKWHDVFIAGEVDVIFCPLPMITALKEHGFQRGATIFSTGFRSIRIEDRIKKLVSIDKQCI